MVSGLKLARLKKDIKNVKIILNDLTPDDRADAIANAMRNAKTKTKPLTAHYVGEVTQPERPQVDVAKLESEAFRRGMFTALQMVIDSLVRELR